MSEMKIEWLKFKLYDDCFKANQIFFFFPTADFIYKQALGLQIRIDAPYEMMPMLYAIAKAREGDIEVAIKDIEEGKKKLEEVEKRSKVTRRLASIAPKNNHNDQNYKETNNCESDHDEVSEERENSENNRKKRNIPTNGFESLASIDPEYNHNYQNNGITSSRKRKVVEPDRDEIDREMKRGKLNEKGPVRENKEESSEFLIESQGDSQSESLSPGNFSEKSGAPTDFFNRNSFRGTPETLEILRNRQIMQSLGNRVPPSALKAPSGFTVDDLLSRQENHSEIIPTPLALGSIYPTPVYPCVEPNRFYHCQPPFFNIFDYLSKIKEYYRIHPHEPEPI